MVNQTLKKSCGVLVIVGCLVSISIEQVYAENIGYVPAQDLRTKTLQLQQEAITTVNNLPTLSQTDLASVIQSPGQVNISVFPVTTTLMTPGTVPPHALNNTTLITQPIFLIGSDNLSQEWLKRNLGSLQQLHAMDWSHIYQQHSILNSCHQ